VKRYRGTAFRHIKAFYSYPDSEKIANNNKKFNLMFMRRAKAYSSSCWQIALVCLQPFRRNSTLEVRGAAENCKKKQCNGTLYFLSSGSFKFINIDTTKKLVTKDCCDGSMPMPICNRFHGRLANNGKITTFRGYRSLMPSCACFIEPRKSRLGPLKSTFNAENFICSLSWSICSEFGTIPF